MFYLSHLNYISNKWVIKIFAVLLTVGCIVIFASYGFDVAAYYGNIAAAASRVETHGAHHCRHRPAHHHLQLKESRTCIPKFLRYANREVGTSPQVIL